MQQVFGWPMGLVTGAMVALFGLLLAGFGFIAWRATILFKLGTRNIRRRWARSALIVFGLTLSTTVIGSALGTGDTMSHTVRSVVSQRLGTIDEIVLLNPSRGQMGEPVRAVAQEGIGGLAKANLGLFDQARAQQVGPAAMHDAAVVTPAILDQITLVFPERQQLQSSMSLVAVPAPIPPVLETLQTVDGKPVDFGALGPDEVVLNTDAASVFGAQAGDPIQIVRNDTRWDGRVRAVVKDGGLGGKDPVVLAPLSAYQAHINAPGKVNSILVANVGGVNSVSRSDEVSQALRVQIADRAAAKQIHDFLAQPEIQHTMEAAESQVSGHDRARVAALRQGAAKPELTDGFISLVSAPRTRVNLYQLGLFTRNGRSILSALNRLNAISVLDIKQETLNTADDFGTVVTTAFLVLGIFSIAAGLILIFLIFQLLEADRLAELATMRALGMTRRQILGMFLFEGLFYDLIGAALGALFGLAATVLTTRALASALADFGFHLHWHVEPRSLLLAFSLGVLLTFTTMAFWAWRASRAEIVAAMRGEAQDESRAWLVGLGGLLLAAGGFVWFRWNTPPYHFVPAHPLVLPGALTLALLGLAVGLIDVAGIVARRATPRRARRLEMLASAVATLLGFALVAVWTRALAALPTPRGEILSDAETIAVGGLFLMLAATWAAARAVGPMLRLMDSMLSAIAPVRAVVRPAIGALNYQRWRTGLVVVMFGMVIFIMVSALTMTNALLGAYAEGEPPVAGFDVRAQVGQPLDLPEALTTSTAISRDAFSVIGSTVTLNVQVVQLGSGHSGWVGERMVAVDDGFLSGIKANLIRRAPGESNADVWHALHNHPGMAVVSAALVGDTGLSVPASSGFRPLSIWMRPEDGGQPVKLTVIGVIDPRSQLPDGIYTSRATAAGMGIDLPSASVYYLEPRQGVKAGDAVNGLRVSFANQGLAPAALSDKVQTAQSIQLLLTQIVQGFMGLGLIAGVAALGMLGVQAVIERRSQLGMLRALGFTRWQSRGTLAFESAVIALLGVALGVGLGLVQAHSLVALLGSNHPELRYSVPWQQIAVTSALALAGSALASGVTVWQAGRISPADALRVED